MIDQNKRRTVKTLSTVMATAMTGATAALSLAPTAASAAASGAVEHSDIDAVVDHLRTHVATLGLDVDIEPTPEHASLFIRFTNVSNSTVSLDHIAPGLVRSGNAVYDINSGLRGGSISMRPHDSVTWVIEPV